MHETKPSDSHTGVWVTVTGVVQGVFFRKSVCAEARRLGVSGWVKNLPTGQVELKAFGRRNEVQALVAFCRVGPPAARVESLDVTWVEYSPCRNGDFHIRYD